MKIVTFGEGMIEISGGVARTGQVSYAGDVLNVSVGMARLGYPPAFLTALGRDSWSDDLIAAWATEGLDTTLIARHPTRAPGLYGVTVDATGERSFTYWRDQSAARDLLAMHEADALLAEAAKADLLFLSGITLSLYDEAGRAKIVALAEAVRASGGDVAFDGNYRPHGWPSAEAARAAFEALAPHISIALPTREDETAVFGETDPAEIAFRWSAAGAREVVVKLGPEGALLLLVDEKVLVPTEPIHPVDTSGAGDSFNAGYLSARASGLFPREAVQFAHVVARETVKHPGAIPPLSEVVRFHYDLRAD